MLRNLSGKIIKLFSLAIFAAIISNSCFFSTEPFRKTRIFDIGLSVPSSCTLRIANIENLSHCKHNFIYRISDTEIERDEFNKWAALPENMLYSKLKTAFKEESNAPLLRIKILKFEFDKRENTVCFSILYSINSEDKKWEKFNKSKKIEIPDPSIIAESMSELSNELTEEIKNKIINGEKNSQ